MQTRLAPAPAPVVRTIPQLADFAARQYGAAPFLLRWTATGWEATSFASAARRTHAFARELAALGVGRGVRVGLQAENRVEWGLAYLAILETGAVVVPIDVLLGPEEIGEILATAGAAWCVVSQRQRGTLEAVRAARLPQLRLASLDEEADLPSFPAALRRHDGAVALDVAIEPGDLAALLFTSGTTGHAKGVMLSHANVLHNVEGVADTFAFGTSDRLLSVLPLHHTFECTIGFLCPLRIGASVAYGRGLKSGELREDLRTSGATLLLGVPLLYEKLLAAMRRGIDHAPAPRRWLARGLLGLSRRVRHLTGRRPGGRLLRPLRRRAGMDALRLFVSGATALPEEVFWGFVDLGWPVLEGYGLTEAAPVVAANRPDRPQPGAVGWPLVGVEVRIDQPDERGDGEIVVRGPNVMLGYYHQPEATAEVLRDGWLHTGDLGRLLPDGRLRVTGRLKNMIATAAGKKIYPEEVETRLGVSPYILEVVVVGGRDARGEREEVHALVVPDLERIEALARTQGSPCDAAFVERILRREVDACCAPLAAYKRVKRVIVRHDPFPKTTTGKIRRQGLARPAEPAARSAVA